MKKQISTLLLALLCVVSLSTNAQSVSLPQANLSASPLGTVENNGSAFAGFDFVESSGSAIPAVAAGVPNVTVSVNFQFITLTDGDISQITGTILDYFTPLYIEDSNLLIFQQNTEIPADWAGSAQFPIIVTENSSQDESFNGLNANIAAVDDSTNAEGNASIFTYTDPAVLNVVDFDELAFDVSPNPTKGAFTIALGTPTDSKVELFDLLGRIVVEKEYTNLDTLNLNIDHLSDAVYVLKVTADGATNTVKIIKE